MIQFPSGRVLIVDCILLALGVWANVMLLRAFVPNRVVRDLTTALLITWLIFSLDFGLAAMLHLGNWISWGRAAGLAWLVVSVLAIPFLRYQQRPHPMQPLRRRFLQTAGLAAVAAPLAAARVGFATTQRDPVVNAVDIPVANLPRDLEGFRIVQISDIHLSPFLSRPQLARAVDLANEQRANLALVTGDLISYDGDPLDDCLAELRRLRSDIGTYGCLGNHEIVAQSEEYTTKQGARMGMQFLRHQAQLLHIGEARLNLAGVDYQRKNAPYLQGARGLQRPGAVNVLLSHNPDVFPIAAEQGWDVTIAGHTHGGQITFEYLHPTLNPGRFITPYVFGLYRKGASSVFVTSGLGTIGLPIRWGVPPEIAVLTLRRHLQTKLDASSVLPLPL